MEKMRNSTAVILWVLIGSFGLLWVMADVNFFDAIQAGPNALGSVNGEEISNEEYQSRIQYYSNAYSQQTGNSMDAEMRAFYENQVWNELVSARLIDQKMDELGITVSDEEVLEQVYGDNPAPVIRQNFTREDGTIDRAAIQQVLSSSQFSQQAIALELQLREQIRQQKLNNFIQAGLQVTKAEVDNEYIKENTTAHVQYVRFPYSEIPEEQLMVTDKELKKYYDENREDYSREESYRFQYVTFSKLPTSDDTTQIIEDLKQLREPFANAENDSLFLARNASSTDFRNTPVSEDDLSEQYEAVLDLEVGEVSEVETYAGQAFILKKTSEKGDEIGFQIMSYTIEALPSTLDAANENASDFQFFASEESSFESEAATRELDLNEAFASKGNSFISGLGSSQQIMNFLKNAEEGEISDVIELATEFIVLEVTEVTKEGYLPFKEVKNQIESIVKTEKRKELTSAKVQELLTSNTSIESLAQAAEMELQSSENLRAASTVIPGAGREPQVIGAIFALDEGTTSKVITGNTAAFVVHIDSKDQADPAEMTDAERNSIQQRLEQQKMQMFSSVWLDQMRENAEIIDNRDRLLQ